MIKFLRLFFICAFAVFVLMLVVAFVLFSISFSVDPETYTKIPFEWFYVYTIEFQRLGVNSLSLVLLAAIVSLPISIICSYITRNAIKKTNDSEGNNG